jgi:hypothetical protein
VGKEALEQHGGVETRFRGRGEGCELTDGAIHGGAPGWLGVSVGRPDSGSRKPMS